MVFPSTPSPKATPPAEDNLPAASSVAGERASGTEPNLLGSLQSPPPEGSTSVTVFGLPGVDAGSLPSTSGRPTSRSPSVASDDSAAKRKRSFTDDVPAGASSEPPAKVAAISSPSALVKMARAIISPFYGANPATDSSQSQPLIIEPTSSAMDVDQCKIAEDERALRRSQRKPSPVIPFGSAPAIATQRSSKQNATTVVVSHRGRTASITPADGSLESDKGSSQSGTRKGKGRVSAAEPIQEDVQMAAPTDQSKSNGSKAPGVSKVSKSRATPSAVPRRKIQKSTSEDESEVATDTEGRTTPRVTKARSNAPSKGGSDPNATTSSQPVRRANASQRKTPELPPIEEEEVGLGDPSGSKGKGKVPLVDEGRRGSTINHDSQIREMAAHLHGAVTGSIATGFRNLNTNMNSRLEQFDRRLSRIEGTIGSSRSKQTQHLNDEDDGADGDVDEDLSSQLLRDGAQKRQVQERRTVRKRALKQQQQEAEKMWKEDPQIALLRRCVREHIRIRLLIDDPLDVVKLMSPSPEVMRAVLDGTQEITAERWQLAWTETKAHKFNKIALDALVNDFITLVEQDNWYGGLSKLPPDATDYDAVHEFADTYVENLLRTHREESNNLLDQRRQQSRRKQRQNYLRKIRRATVQKAPSARKHQHIMDLLGNHCASADESDSTAGVKQKAYRRYVPRWRSNACGAFLGRLDNVRLSMEENLAALSGRQPRGSSAHIRIHTGIEHTSDAAPRGLPINCYHRPWYRSLNDGQKRWLQATEDSYDFSLQGDSDIDAREPDRADSSDEASEAQGGAEVEDGEDLYT